MCKISSLLTDGSALFHHFCSFKDNIQEQEVVNDSLDGDDMDDNDEEEIALMEMRQNVQKSHTYQYKDRTREYRETNYLQQYVSISVNAFWLDYLTHEGNSPFLSQVSVQCDIKSNWIIMFLTENQ